MDYIKVKWYHWIWLWMFKTQVVVDIDKRGSKIQTTTVTCKIVGGIMYVLDVQYSFEKKTKHTRGSNDR